MKPGGRTLCSPMRDTFSTLNSGLRDETCRTVHVVASGPPFSTLNSGLRDETTFTNLDTGSRTAFQYPQLGPTR